jgi:uncharacterized protein
MASEAAARRDGEWVEVVYASADEQAIVRLPLEAGLTAEQAVRRSGLLERHPEIEGRPLVLGVFGVAVPPERRLTAGDRVEICRPLPQDPRARRRAVAKGAVGYQRGTRSGPPPAIGDPRR